MNSASYIIWHEALQCSLAPLTWGIDFFDLRTLYNNKGVESGIAFHIIGSWIHIEYNEAENNFAITFIPTSLIIVTNSVQECSKSARTSREIV